jgi:hypothetical protein
MVPAKKIDLYFVKENRLKSFDPSYKQKVRLKCPSIGCLKCGRGARCR